MRSAGSEGGKRTVIPWLAPTLNLLPLPLGIGYLYLRRFQAAGWSIIIRFVTVLAAWLFAFPASLWIPFIKCGDADECDITVEMSIAILTPIAISLILSAVHAYVLSTKINSGRRDV